MVLRENKMNVAQVQLAEKVFTYEQLSVKVCVPLGENYSNYRKMYSVQFKNEHMLQTLLVALQISFCFKHSM